MYYKFKNEEALDKFSKSDINSEANLKISKIIGTSIFKANEIDNRGQIVEIDGTDLARSYIPIFNKDEVEEYLEVVSYFESNNSKDDNINIVKNELLVIRRNLLDEVFRIDILLNKMEKF